MKKERRQVAFTQIKDKLNYLHNSETLMMAELDAQGFEQNRAMNNLADVVNLCCKKINLTSPRRSNPPVLIMNKSFET